MIRNVPEARRRLLIVLIVLLVLDAAAVALLLSPLGRSRSARENDYSRVRAELQAKRRESLPARGMDQKLDTARKQIDVFYRDRLPTRYSEISAQLGKLANENKIQITGIRYEEQDVSMPGVQRIGIDASLTGDYANEMKFINALERNKLFFVVNSVLLGEAQEGTVRLQVRFETYIRTAA
ncbi:MAG TPA: hypothetical protein VN622_02080 [Clostridia bacterium]|nr:hypothetical protein [Clostridia bacterium]